MKIKRKRKEGRKEKERELDRKIERIRKKLVNGIRQKKNSTY